MWTKHSGFKSRAAACLQQFEEKTEPGVKQRMIQTPLSFRTLVTLTHSPYSPLSESQRDFCLSDFYKHLNCLYMRNVHTPARKLPASSTSLRSAPIGLHPLGMKGMPWGHLFWPQSVHSPSRLGPSMGREPGRGLLLLKG